MSAPHRYTSLSRFLVPFALTALLGVLWSLASPVFSVPDENAHATKAIAQVHGQIVGYTVPEVRHIVVDLPPGFEYSPQILCFATLPHVPASCATELGDPGGADWVATWVGAYNPIYYYLVGWPSLLIDGNAAVYAMRIASALLAAVLIGLAYLAASSGPRARWMPLVVAFSAAPMTVYLFGAVNPNGAEIAAAIALWAALLRLLETFDDRLAPGILSEPPGLSRTALWLIVVTASAILVNARALGPLWLVMVVGACLLIAGWAPTKRLFTTPVSFAWIGGIAAAGLFSLWWTLSGGSLSSQAEASDAPLVGGTFWQGFTYVMRSTPDFLQQALGYFGWLDLPLPTWTYWLVVAAVSVPLVLAGAATRRRSTIVYVVVVAAALLVPALVQGYSVHQTGIIWQGRYGLFLYYGVLIVAGWLLGRSGDRAALLAPRVTAVSTALLAVFGFLAFGLVLVRYVIGWGSPLGQMISAPEWQPPLGWMALVALYGLLSAAIVLAASLHARTLSRREPMSAQESRRSVDV